MDDLTQINELTKRMDAMDACNKIYNDSLLHRIEELEKHLINLEARLKGFEK